ncbi:MAG TPA: anti-sigma factor [Xanthobacteraceae bacterium]|nr:anti-sigma factor [Xanthobacteraceae bacterium]
MSDDPTITGEDGDFTAAEYVLGVLDAARRREAEQRLSRDPAFAAEVAFWEERFGALTRDVRPIPPPPSVWDLIETAIAPRRERASLWDSIGFWRWSAIGSAALAAACLAALVYVETVRAPSPPLVAKLEAGGRADFVAAVDAGRSTITIVPAALTDVQQRALELWLIAPGDQPRSLGLIEPGRPVRISVPRALAGRIGAESALAVSIEPPGGSPTGLPTGPVIASGKFVNL